MTITHKKTYCWLLWTLAIFGVGLDQAGKYEVFRRLYDTAAARPDHKADQTVIPGALTFHVELAGERWAEDASLLQTWSGSYQPHVNKGAFLGFGNGDGGGPSYNLTFAIVSVVAGAAIVWWSTRRSIASDPFLCAALGLILGGTLGNLYDRVVFDGVRDYLYWSFIIPTAVFNIADFSLVCGAGLLLIQAFWGRKDVSESSGCSAPAKVANMAEASNLMRM
jgi:signal peptidase II